MGLDIPIPFLIFGGVIVLIGLGFAISAYTEKRRREALQGIAEELGLAFFPTGDAGLIGELSDLPLFSKGRSKRMANLIQGETDDVSMGIFDYRYTIGSGKSSATHHQSVAFFRSGSLSLPAFELRPQSFFHGIGKLFGYQDIDFDTHPAFSMAFLLRGSSEKQLRAAFTAEVLTYFEHKPGVCVEGRLHDLVFYRHAKRVKPDKIKELMNEGFQVFAALRKDA